MSRHDPPEPRGHRRRAIAERIENDHLGIREPDDDARDQDRDHHYPRDIGAQLTDGDW